MGESSFISQTNPIFNNTIFDLKDTNYCTVNFVLHTGGNIVTFHFLSKYSAFIQTYKWTTETISRIL